MAALVAHAGFCKWPAVAADHAAVAVAPVAVAAVVAGVIAISATVAVAVAVTVAAVAAHAGFTKLSRAQEESCITSLTLKGSFLCPRV